MEHRVLLTGTPIQNNMNELYALLSFVAPRIFSHKYRHEFVATFSDVTADEANELHALLVPFLLRRIKTEVVHDLPSKTEVVLYHGLSALQKKYYKAILQKDAGRFFPRQSSFICRRSVKKAKLDLYAMKRVAAGAHLPPFWLFEPAKRPDDRADYCLGTRP